MASPKLRFKEFDGKWSLTSLNQLSTKIGDGIHATPKYDENGIIPFINGNNLVNGKILINENIKRISAEEFQKYNQILSDRTLFLSINGTIGNLAFYKNEKVLLGKSVCFINLKDDIDDKFVYLLLQSPQLTKTFNSELTGTTIKNLSLATVRNSEFYCPSVAEQTKIASFLSAVDEKISLLTKKHELLSQYKQGMMQKLFSQQIRFKADDGSEFEEWEEKRLIDSIDTNIKWSFTGGPFGSNLKSEDYTATGIRIIQLQNIGDGVFLDSYKIYTSFEKANELLSCNIYPSEILISKMGDPVARCCIVPDYHDRYVMCSDGIRLVVDKLKFSSVFMFYQINYQDFRQSASDVSTGSTRKRIGLNDLKQLPIKVPCLEEQTKIANFLSAIDQKIEVVAQQIEQAKQWKKGLLQQMFV
ncbi:restriction endonuclease subunit S [Acinetobacter pittii]|uniref:restriction endonuclease subunit S n=1 Tax=Acinetobacter pittii TaxID=48296 RepID=UPI00083E1712|nr:restriction endonuclease subunit S [Acinetobacter pittii]MCU4430266.1 restriction endonuclease subunit S [Acinetobacter pittii]MCU4532031.1 restriction endonuclease subunit S [Acinetobacter pittii]ODI96497.1 hypothetical protein BFR91_02585 [Acinetobacter pittii]